MFLHHMPWDLSHLQPTPRRQRWLRVKIDRNGVGAINDKVTKAIPVQICAIPTTNSQSIDNI